MIKQCLLNKNENTTVLKLKKKESKQTLKQATRRASPLSQPPVSIGDTTPRDAALDYCTALLYSTTCKQVVVISLSCAGCVKLLLAKFEGDKKKHSPFTSDSQFHAGCR
jgi:hypothetical protein